MTNYIQNLFYPPPLFVPRAEHESSTDMDLKSGDITAKQVFEPQQAL